MYMRINLLPAKYSRKRVSALYELAAMAGLVVLTLGGLYGWYWYTSSEIDRLQAEIAGVRGQIERLKKEVVRVDEFKNKARALEDKLKVIEELKVAKSGPVHVLDDLATVLTRVGDVWLTAISDKEGVLTLELCALRHDKISEFMEQLSARSRYFKDIRLVLSEAKEDKAITFFVFKVTAAVVYDAPAT